MQNKTKTMIVMILVISFLAGPVMAAQKLVTLTGTIEKSDSGLVIKTDKGVFPANGPDLNSFVGKKVVATGKFTQTDTGKIFTVISLRKLTG